jgi:hypothetical protein
VVYGLVEGLAGVVDRDVAYRVAGLAPRWPAAGTDAAKVTIHYPASGGYVAYDYRHDAARREIALTLTGSGDRAECHVLLPNGVAAATAVVDGDAAVAFTTSRVESSAYVDFTLALTSPRTVPILRTISGESTRKDRGATILRPGLLHEATHVAAGVAGTNSSWP